MVQTPLGFRVRVWGFLTGQGSTTASMDFIIGGYSECTWKRRDLLPNVCSGYTVPEAILHKTQA